jgi:hypothetical protein
VIALGVQRHHFADEEPDVDERSIEDQWDAEEKFGRDHCDRCGVAGHVGRRCPTVTPLLLRHE